MYTVGLDTGIVLSMNPDNTYAIPVYEDCKLPGFANRKYGGNHLARILGDMLIAENVVQ